MAPLITSHSRGFLFPLSLVLVLVLFFVYALYPNQNPTADAYEYAANVRWQVNIWQPHHLLYNVTGLALFKLLQRVGFAFQPLVVMQLMNSFFAATSLLVLWRILAKLQQNVKVQAGLLLIAGVSFGTMRYATENETYILPLFFSLLGTYHWFCFIKERKHLQLTLSGFFTAFACLYHQIHFFWWLGLLLSLLFNSSVTKKDLFSYVAPALVVPVVYASVIWMNNLHFTQAHRFVFMDFYSGGVETNITYRNFLLTFISLGRTFFEVHGRIYYLIKGNVFYIIPAIITSTLMVKAGLDFHSSRKGNRVNDSFAFKTVGLILALQLLFAWYAVGNAEFMVMVPPLVVILIACCEIRRALPLCLLGGSLFCWNMGYGVLPNFYHTYSNTPCIEELLVKHPQAVFLLEDRYAFRTFHLYQTGRYPNQVYDTQADSTLLKQAIAAARLQHRPVITDYNPNNQVITRAWLMKKYSSSTFFQRFHLRPITYCPTLYGNTGLFMLTDTDVQEKVIGKNFKK